MKTKAIAVCLFSALLSAATLADECTQACEEDYKACKEVAESGTAKQACEDDITACKTDCSN